MKTPTTTEIEQCARELWHRDRGRSGDPSFDIEPELDELREGGFIVQAVSELMVSEDSRYKAHIEEEARNLGLIRETQKGTFTVNLNLNAKRPKEENAAFRLVLMALLTVIIFGIKFMFP